VLERADSAGGMAASFEVAGVRVDHGSHRLHPATPPHVMSALRGLLGDDLQTRPRNGRLRIGDRWVGFPLRVGDLLRALPPRTVAGIARDAVTGVARRPRSDTYDEVLRAGLGSTLYEALYAPYAVKLWGLDPTRISGEQARRRVTADTPWKVAARVLRGARGNGQGQVFHYPRGGFGQIVDVLAAAAVDAGADVRLGHAVDAVVTDGARPLVSAGASSVEAGRVFSTIPLTALARVCSPAAPPAVVEAASALRFRAMVLVYLVHDGGRWTPFDAHYLPGLGTPVTRLSEPANYRLSADDPTDRTVLCAEIPCTIGDSIWSATDADLAAVVTEALAMHGPAGDRAVDRRRTPPAERLPGLRGRLRATPRAARRLGGRPPRRDDVRPARALRARQHASRAGDGMGRGGGGAAGRELGRRRLVGRQGALREPRGRGLSRAHSSCRVRRLPP
jgi:protoporphyrinogen oxidase